MTDLKQQIAVTALNDMFQRGSFNICTIDSVAAALGVVPNAEVRKLLHPLHCVDYSKMPAEVRTALPGLIRECIGVEPVFQFLAGSLVKRDLEASAEPIDITPTKRGLLKLLGFSSK